MGSGGLIIPRVLLCRFDRFRGRRGGGFQQCWNCAHVLHEVLHEGHEQGRAEGNIRLPLRVDVVDQLIEQQREATTGDHLAQRPNDAGYPVIHRLPRIQIESNA